MKKISLTLGAPTPEFASPPHLEALKHRTYSGKISAPEKRPRSRFPDVAPDTGEANPPVNPHNPPQRKNKTIRLRELQRLVPFPASTLRRMTRDGIFVKAARGATPTRKWNRGAVEQWLAGPQLGGSWPASDAYGTAHDPDPQIRRHMRAILNGSAEPMGRARV